MNFDEILETLGQWLLTNGPVIIIILALMFVALKATGMVSGLLQRIFSKGREDPEIQKRAATLSAVIRHILVVAVFLVSGMMLLERFGVDITPILATAGVLGLAVGFGAQHVVRDILAGFFILLEDQIRVGDVVQIADKGGLVEHVNLRMTILRDLAGNVHYVRNGEITVVTNMTKEYSRYVFDIGVAYREDVDEVIEVMKQVDEELRSDPEFKNDILLPLEVLGLDQFADSALIIKARTTTKPIQQWRVGREFNRRLKKRFDELDIEIPFPHVTLYPGQDKNGEAPSLQVATNRTVTTVDRD